MDTVRFRCDGCGKDIQAPATAAGKKGKCPFCGHSNAVPELPKDAEEDTIPLAPLDEEDERRRREEIDAMVESEKVLRSEDHAEERIPLEEREDLKSEDLHHFVINYCIDMSNSNIERAEMHAAKLRSFGPAGAKAVEDFLMDQMLEPALDSIPQPVLQGFLKQLFQAVQEP